MQGEIVHPLEWTSFGPARQVRAAPVVAPFETWITGGASRA